MANSSMPWVKLYIDMLDDHKLGKLPRSARLRFVELLLIAGECDADGGLINGDTPMAVADIAWRLRDSVDTVSADIATLTAVGLVSTDADVICITNFSKRQGRSQAEKRAAWRERKARQKEGDPKGESDSRVNHAGVTQDSPSRVEESREDESRGEKNDGANAPIIITQLSPDADVANAAGKPDFDKLARDAGIHNQSAPPRRNRKWPTNITEDDTDDERILAYLRILQQDEITQSNAENIQKRVSDLGLWAATLTEWAIGTGSKSYNPTKFSEMFQNYDRRVISASTPKVTQTKTGATEPAGFDLLRRMTGGGNAQ